LLLHLFASERAYTRPVCPTHRTHRPRPSSAMVPSDDVNSSKAQRSHGSQAPQKTGKTRRHRRPKSKRREILVEQPAQASTSVSSVQPKSWPWISITEPPTTKHPPVFTKDGRCVLRSYQSFPFSDFVYTFQLLFFYRWFQREDILDRYWACCIDPL
jgi:hypothetical protein